MEQVKLDLLNHDLVKELVIEAYQLGAAETTLGKEAESREEILELMRGEEKTAE